MKRGKTIIGFIVASLSGAAGILAIAINSHFLVVPKDRAKVCYGNIGGMRWLQGLSEHDLESYLNNSVDEKVAAGKRAAWRLAEKAMHSDDDLLRDYFDECIDGKAPWE